MAHVGPVTVLLEQQFDVLAPTLPGHPGGPELADVADVVPALVDGREAMLD